MLRQENAQFAQLLASIRDQLESGSRGTMSAAPSAPSSPTGTGSEPGPGNQAAVDRFQSAMEQYQLGNYSTARRRFQEVIEQYPMETEISSEAQYKLGEILLVEQKPAEALTAFSQVRQIWPSSRKVPDAVFQVAQIHLDQGRRDEARRQFQFVVDNYPNTQAAATAQERLRSIPPG